LGFDADFAFDPNSGARFEKGGEGVLSCGGEAMLL
jgi:hypothetical protein